MPSEFAFGIESRLIYSRGRLAIDALQKVITGSVFHLGADSVSVHHAAIPSASMVFVLHRR
jgi:hypothetical protein